MTRGRWVKVRTPREYIPTHVGTQEPLNDLPRAQSLVQSNSACDPDSSLRALSQYTPPTLSVPTCSMDLSRPCVHRTYPAPDALPFPSIAPRASRPRRRQSAYLGVTSTACTSCRTWLPLSPSPPVTTTATRPPSAARLESGIADPIVAAGLEPQSGLASAFSRYSGLNIGGATVAPRMAAVVRRWSSRRATRGGAPLTGRANGTGGRGRCVSRRRDGEGTRRGRRAGR